MFLSNLGFFSISPLSYILFGHFHSSKHAVAYVTKLSTHSYFSNNWYTCTLYIDYDYFQHAPEQIKIIVQFFWNRDMFAFIQQDFIHARLVHIYSVSNTINKAFQQTHILIPGYNVFDNSHILNTVLTLNMFLNTKYSTL